MKKEYDTITYVENLYAKFEKRYGYGYDDEPQVWSQWLHELTNFQLKKVYRIVCDDDDEDNIYKTPFKVAVEEEFINRLIIEKILLKE